MTRSPRIVGLELIVEIERRNAMAGLPGSGADARAEPLGDAIARHDAVDRPDGGERRRAAGEDARGKIAHVPRR